MIKRRWDQLVALWRNPLTRPLYGGVSVIALQVIIELRLHGPPTGERLLDVLSWWVPAMCAGGMIALGVCGRLLTELRGYLDDTHKINHELIEMLRQRAGKQTSPRNGRPLH